MKLTLDHTQRLNLHALLGAQRADVGSVRAIWAVRYPHRARCRRGKGGRVETTGKWLQITTRPSRREREQISSDTFLSFRRTDRYMQYTRFYSAPT